MRILMVFCNLVTVISISLFLSFLLPQTSSLSLKQTTNFDLYKSKFAPSGRKIVSESEPQKNRETLVLHKGDEVDTNLWHTSNGNIVRLVLVPLSSLEDVNKPRFHEPAFLRDDTSNKHCKHEDGLSLNSQGKSADFVAQTLQDIKPDMKIKFSEKTNSDRFTRYEPRTFFGPFFPSSYPPFGPPGPPGPWDFGPPMPYPPPYMGPDPYWY